MLWEVVFGAWTAAGVAAAAAGRLVLTLLLLFLSDPERGGKLSGGFGSVALVKIASLCGFREFLEDLRRKKQVVRACPLPFCEAKHNDQLIPEPALKGCNVHLNRRGSSSWGVCGQTHTPQRLKRTLVSLWMLMHRCLRQRATPDCHPQDVVWGEHDPVHRSPAQGVVNDFHSLHHKTRLLCPPHTATNRRSGAQLQSRSNLRKRLGHLQAETYQQPQEHTAQRHAA